MGENGYEFYLKKCLLPVTPSKLELKINNANKTLTLVNEGEINILKRPGLTDIEFTCCLPQTEYPFAVYRGGFREADYFLDYFENLKIGRKPFQFIVCRSLAGSRKLFSTNIRVTLEDYKVTEDAGEGPDVTVKIRLKQWRDYGTKTVNIVLETAQAAVEPQREETASPAPPQPVTYTVVRGDCLYSIAKKFYGNGARYTVIYDANRSVVGGNPNLIYPGQVLTIPAV